MSFFGPPPQPPSLPTEPSRWGPPLWDRAAEDTLGISVGLTVVLAVTDEHAVVFDNVHAYPNGFTFDVVQIRNPNVPVDMTERHPPPMFVNGPRVGLEFADGSTAVSPDHAVQAAPGLPGPGFPSTAVVSAVAPAQGRPGFDADGVPIGHVLRNHGGGGSQYRSTSNLWCFRLPAPGTMVIHADWPDHFDEVAIDVDAAPILDAASRSQVLWPRR